MKVRARGSWTGRAGSGSGAAGWTCVEPKRPRSTGKRKAGCHHAEIVSPTRFFIDVMENLCLPAQQVKPKAATFTPSKTDSRNSKRRIVAFDEKNLDDEEQEEECMPRRQWKTLEGDKASIPAIESGDVEIETFEEEKEEEEKGEEDEEEEEDHEHGAIANSRPKVSFSTLAK